ncbi:MAG: peptide deformylase [Chloroflexota bacterium]
MAVLPVRHHPDRVLRRKARRVTIVDDSIRKLAANMLETMEAVKGVGLAAPQVGVSLRVIVLGLPGEAPQVIINPEIVKRSGVRQIGEACLSIPGYAGEVERSVSVVVKGLDREGKKLRVRASELLAQALEHEIDHLNGILYVDRVGGEDKLVKVEPASEEQAG